MAETVTQYEYGPNGTLVASYSTTESPWGDPAEYAQMKALDLFEATCCPGCYRPIDVCAADKEPITVDSHTCSFQRARAIQSRMDDAEHQGDGEPAFGQPRHDDGQFYIPRHSTPDELLQIRGSHGVARRDDSDLG